MVPTHPSTNINRKTFLHCGERSISGGEGSLGKVTKEKKQPYSTWKSTVF